MRIFITILLFLPLLILTQITTQGFVFRAPSETSSTIATIKLVVDQDKKKIYFNGTFTTNSKKKNLKIKKKHKKNSLVDFSDKKT